MTAIFLFPPPIYIIRLLYAFLFLYGDIVTCDNSYEIIVRLQE